MPLSGFGAATLRALATAMTPLLADQCLVKRPTEASDGAMGISETFPVVGTYACYVEPLGRLGGKEGEDAGRVTGWERYRISFVTGTDIRLQDVITQVATGSTYTVVDSIDTQTNSPLLTANAVYASK